jgi:hypothetical protein
MRCSSTVSDSSTTTRTAAASRRTSSVTRRRTYASLLRLKVDEIDVALARIDDGSYGRCDECYEAISQASTAGPAAGLYVCLVPRKRLIDRINFTVIVIALVVTAIDASTKFWARHVWRDTRIHVGGVIWLRLQYNSGISFSINQFEDLLVTTIATVAVAVVVVRRGLNANRRRFPTIGFGLLIGGGVANVVDRLSAVPTR